MICFFKTIQDEQTLIIQTEKKNIIIMYLLDPNNNNFVLVVTKIFHNYQLTLNFELSIQHATRY